MNDPIMVKVAENIFVGNAYQADFLSRNSNSTKWFFLHCAKTYHQKMLNYTKSLPRQSPYYLIVTKGNETALNLVDMNYNYDNSFFAITRDALEKAFDFLDEKRAEGRSIFIHCDQGESRGPSVAMLYLARIGKYDYKDFETTVELFSKDYKYYIPSSRKIIYVMIKDFWDYFVKKPQNE